MQKGSRIWPGKRTYISQSASSCNCDGVGLLTLFSKLAKDSKNTDMLERYWIAQKAKMPEDPQRPLSGETPLSSPAVTFTGETPTEGRKKHGRNRSLSDGGALAPSQQQLSTYHPAWSLTRLLDQFGPLIFPIHRAALLRKRILISSHAPVHEVCDFGKPNLSSSEQ